MKVKHQPDGNTSLITTEDALELAEKLKSTKRAVGRRKDIIKTFIIEKGYRIENEFAKNSNFLIAEVLMFDVYNIPGDQKTLTNEMLDIRITTVINKKIESLQKTVEQNWSYFDKLLGYDNPQTEHQAITDFLNNTEITSNQDIIGTYNKGKTIPALITKIKNQKTITLMIGKTGTGSVLYAVIDYNRKILEKFKEYGHHKAEEGMVIPVKIEKYQTHQKYGNRLYVKTKIDNLR